VTNSFIEAIDIIKTALYDPNQLYKNNGDGTFTDVSSAAGVADGDIGRGATFAINHPVVIRFKVKLFFRAICSKKSNKVL